MESLELLKKINEELYERVRVKTVLNPELKKFVSENLSLSKIAEFSEMEPNDAMRALEALYESKIVIDPLEARLKQLDTLERSYKRTLYMAELEAETIKKDAQEQAKKLIKDMQEKVEKLSNMN